MVPLFFREVSTTPTGIYDDDFHEQVRAAFRNFSSYHELTLYENGGGLLRDGTPPASSDLLTFNNP